ncbi:MAG: ester cyclase [Alphaproteobacteria bacterium]|nr:ester cyclase [Alphaproteobacteria bacterium]
MTDKKITPVAITHIHDMLNPDTDKRQDLPGFDPIFVDFPNYIIRITDWIWHERKIDLCLKYYTENCVIHTQAGDIIGAEAVAANTHATLKTFPDRRLDGDNVIWSNEGKAGFYSSHLITSKMTNRGPSEFGPATRRKIRAYTIADCLCRENKVYEEWLFRDNAGIGLQMGFDIRKLAHQAAKQDLIEGNNLLHFHQPNYARTQAAAQTQTQAQAEFPSLPEQNAKAFAQAVFINLWQNRNMELLSDIYDFRVRARYPQQKDFYGPDELSPYLENLLNAFPEAKLHIEHVGNIPYLGEARDIAIRWSLAGEHIGESDYGAPTYAPIYLMGASHWRVIGGRIHEDITIWDDIALRRQIETARLLKHNS